MAAERREKITETGAAIEGKAAEAAAGAGHAAVAGAQDVASHLEDAANEANSGTPAGVHEETTTPIADQVALEGADREVEDPLAGLDDSAFRGSGNGDSRRSDSGSSNGVTEAPKGGRGEGRGSDSELSITERPSSAGNNGANTTTDAGLASNGTAAPESTTPVTQTAFDTTPGETSREDLGGAGFTPPPATEAPTQLGDNHGNITVGNGRVKADGQDLGSHAIIDENGARAARPGEIDRALRDFAGPDTGPDSWSGDEGVGDWPEPATADGNMTHISGPGYEVFTGPDAHIDEMHLPDDARVDTGSSPAGGSEEVFSAGDTGVEPEDDILDGTVNTGNPEASPIQIDEHGQTTYATPGEYDESAATGADRDLPTEYPVYPGSAFHPDNIGNRAGGDQAYPTGHGFDNSEMDGFESFDRPSPDAPSRSLYSPGTPTDYGTIKGRDVTVDGQPAHPLDLPTGEASESGNDSVGVPLPTHTQWGAGSTTGTEVADAGESDFGPAPGDETEADEPGTNDEEDLPGDGQPDSEALPGTGDEADVDGSDSTGTGTEAATPTRRELYDKLMRDRVHDPNFPKNFRDSDQYKAWSDKVAEEQGAAQEEAERNGDAGAAIDGHGPENADADGEPLPKEAEEILEDLSRIQEDIDAKTGPDGDDAKPKVDEDELPPGFADIEADAIDDQTAYEYGLPAGTRAADVKELRDGEDSPGALNSLWDHLKRGLAGRYEEMVEEIDGKTVRSMRIYGDKERHTDLIDVATTEPGMPGSHRTFLASHGIHDPVNLWSRRPPGHASKAQHVHDSAVRRGMHVAERRRQRQETGELGLQDLVNAARQVHGARNDARHAEKLAGHARTKKFVDLDEKMQARRKDMIGDVPRILTPHKDVQRAAGQTAMHRQIAKVQKRHSKLAHLEAKAEVERIKEQLAHIRKKHPIRYHIGFHSHSNRVKALQAQLEMAQLHKKAAKRTRNMGGLSMAGAHVGMGMPSSGNSSNQAA